MGILQWGVVLMGSSVVLVGSCPRTMFSVFKHILRNKYVIHTCVLYKSVHDVPCATRCN